MKWKRENKRGWWKGLEHVAKFKELIKYSFLVHGQKYFGLKFIFKFQVKTDLWFPSRNELVFRLLFLAYEPWVMLAIFHIINRPSCQTWMKAIPITLIKWLTFIISVLFLSLFMLNMKKII